LRAWNLISNRQTLGELLFERCNCNKLHEETKPGYSTACCLERLAPISPIKSKMLEYRQIANCNPTYIVGLQDFILQDGKIHTVLQDLTQTVVC
jgi:DNA polymerase-1